MDLHTSLKQQDKIASFVAQRLSVVAHRQNYQTAGFLMPSCQPDEEHNDAKMPSRIGSAIDEDMTR
jgi:hypothetical protein